MKTRSTFVMGITALLSVAALWLTLGATYNPGGVDSPPGYAFVITPNDSTDLTTITRSIWVGSGGDIVVIYAGNSAQVTLKNVPSGSRLSGRFSRVLNTNTTASNLVAEY